MASKGKLKKVRNDSVSSNGETKATLMRGTFEITTGTLIEALDYTGKWYNAKVLNIDVPKKQLLVHFNGWNSKFDVWLPPNSPKIRPPKVNPKTQQKKWHVGERVVAKWGPAGKIYPATIAKEITETKVELLFFDGFKKILNKSSLLPDTEKLYRKFHLGSPTKAYGPVKTPLFSSTTFSKVEITPEILEHGRAKRRLAEPATMSDFVTDSNKKRKDSITSEGDVNKKRKDSITSEGDLKKKRKDSTASEVKKLSPQADVSSTKTKSSTATSKTKSKSTVQNKDAINSKDDTVKTKLFTDTKPAPKKQESNSTTSNTTKQSTRIKNKKSIESLSNIVNKTRHSDGQTTELQHDKLTKNKNMANPKENIEIVKKKSKSYVMYPSPTSTDQPSTQSSSTHPHSPIIDAPADSALLIKFPFSIQRKSRKKKKRKSTLNAMEIDRISNKIIEEISKDKTTAPDTLEVTPTSSSTVTDVEESKKAVLDDVIVSEQVTVTEETSSAKSLDIDNSATFEKLLTGTDTNEVELESEKNEDIKVSLNLQKDQVETVKPETNKELQKSKTIANQKKKRKSKVVGLSSFISDNKIIDTAQDIIESSNVVLKPTEEQVESHLKKQNETPLKETPYEEPNESFFGESNETSLEKPNETPLEKPNETPLRELNETPFKEPNETSLEKLNEISLGEPKETPFKEPNETSLEKSNESPLGEPIEIPLEKLNENSFGESSEIALEKPNKTSMGEENQTPLGEPDNMLSEEKIEILDPIEKVIQSQVIGAQTDSADIKVSEEKKDHTKESQEASTDKKGVVIANMGSAKRKGFQKKSGERLRRKSKDKNKVNAAMFLKEANDSISTKPEIRKEISPTKLEARKESIPTKIETKEESLSAEVEAKKESILTKSTSRKESITRETETLNQYVSEVQTDMPLKRVPRKSASKYRTVQIETDIEKQHEQEQISDDLNKLRRSRSKDKDIKQSSVPTKSEANTVLTDKEKRRSKDDAKDSKVSNKREERRSRNSSDSKQSDVNLSHSKEGRRSADVPHNKQAASLASERKESRRSRDSKSPTNNVTDVRKERRSRDSKDTKHSVETKSVTKDDVEPVLAKREPRKSFSKYRDIKVANVANTAVPPSSVKNAKKKENSVEENKGLPIVSSIEPQKRSARKSASKYRTIEVEASKSKQEDVNVKKKKLESIETKRTRRVSNTVVEESNKIIKNNEQNERLLPNVKDIEKLKETTTKVSEVKDNPSEVLKLDDFVSGGSIEDSKTTNSKEKSNVVSLTSFMSVESGVPTNQVKESTDKNSSEAGSLREISKDQSLVVESTELENITTKTVSSMQAESSFISKRQPRNSYSKYRVVAKSLDVSGNEQKFTHRKQAEIKKVMSFQERRMNSIQKHSQKKAKGRTVTQQKGLHVVGQQKGLNVVGGDEKGKKFEDKYEMFKQKWKAEKERRRRGKTENREIDNPIESSAIIPHVGITTEETPAISTTSEVEIPVTSDALDIKGSTSEKLPERRGPKIKHTPSSRLGKKIILAPRRRGRPSKAMTQARQQLHKQQNVTSIDEVALKQDELATVSLEASSVKIIKESKRGRPRKRKAEEIDADYIPPDEERHKVKVLDISRTPNLDHTLSAASMVTNERPWLQKRPLSENTAQQKQSYKKQAMHQYTADPRFNQQSRYFIQNPYNRPFVMGPRYPMTAAQIVASKIQRRVHHQRFLSLHASTDGYPPYRPMLIPPPMALLQPPPPPQPQTVELITPHVEQVNDLDNTDDIIVIQPSEEQIPQKQQQVEKKVPEEIDLTNIRLDAKNKASCPDIVQFKPQAKKRKTLDIITAGLSHKNLLAEDKLHSSTGVSAFVPQSSTLTESSVSAQFQPAKSPIKSKKEKKVFSTSPVSQLKQLLSKKHRTTDNQTKKSKPPTLANENKKVSDNLVLNKANIEESLDVIKTSEGSVNFAVDILPKPLDGTLPKPLHGIIPKPLDGIIRKPLDGTLPKPLDGIIQKSGLNQTCPLSGVEPEKCQLKDCKCKQSLKLDKAKGLGSEDLNKVDGLSLKKPKKKKIVIGEGYEIRSKDKKKLKTPTNVKGIIVKENIFDEPFIEEYKCMEKGCQKAFRKQHLLEYHVKYFHTIKPIPKRSRSSVSVSSTDSNSTSAMTSPAENTKITPNDSSSRLSSMDGGNSEYSSSEESEMSEEEELPSVDDCVKCVCEDDCELGFMIQCEQCFTWQHGECVGYSQQKSVPLFYLCHICSKPKGLRKSCTYNNDYTWYRHGKFPPVVSNQNKLSDVTNAVDEDDEEVLSSIMLTTHGMMTDLYNIRDVLQNIRKRYLSLRDSNNDEMKVWKEKNLITDVTKEIIPNGISDQTNIDSNNKTYKFKDGQLKDYVEEILRSNKENKDGVCKKEKKTEMYIPKPSQPNSEMKINNENISSLVFNLNTISEKENHSQHKQNINNASVKIIENNVNDTTTKVTQNNLINTNDTAATNLPLNRPIENHINKNNAIVISDNSADNSINSPIENDDSIETSETETAYTDEDSIPYGGSDSESETRKNRINKPFYKAIPELNKDIKLLKCYGLQKSDLYNIDIASESNENLIARYYVLCEIEKIEDQIQERLLNMNEKMDELESEYNSIDKSKEILRDFRTNFKLPDTRTLMNYLNKLKWNSILNSTPHQPSSLSTTTTSVENTNATVS